MAEIGYDFRAPLGQYGQVRESYGRLRTLHSFMAAFGPEMALMATTVGDATDPADLKHLRVAARAAGDSGFVFINNHCRHHALPDFRDVQLHLHQHDGRVTDLPSSPTDVPAGASFIWPVGQRLGAARLRHATVQPLTRWDEGGGVTWVGFVVLGVRAELCFEAVTVRTLRGVPETLRRNDDDGRLVVHLDAAASLPILLQITDTAGAEHRIVLLSQAQADACSRQRIAGRERLLLCEHALHVEGDTAVVLAHGATTVQAWPADDLGAVGVDEGFASWSDTPAAPDTLPVRWQLMCDAQQPPARRDGPFVEWRGRRVPLAPADAAYEAGMQLRIELDAPCPPGTRVLLSLDYLGDAARLWADGVLVDDQFADGQAWHIGLHRFLRDDGRWPEFRLQIVPADPDLPIFLEEGARRRLEAAAPQRAAVLSVEARVWRRARLQFEAGEAPTWLA